MAIKSPNPKKPKASSVALAVAAVVEGNPHPLDMSTRGIDPAPTSLDLPEIERQDRCSRCGRPAVRRREGMRLVPVWGVPSV